MNDISSAPTRPLSGAAGFADAVDNLVASDEKVPYKERERERERERWTWTTSEIKVTVERDDRGERLFRSALRFIEARETFRRIARENAPRLHAAPSFLLP